MTSPGGHGNEVNLAALWVPVMPETSHMGEEMKKTGAEAKRKFEEGFNSSGSSPETLGQSFGSKMSASIAKEFQHFELPFGMSTAFEKLGGDIDKNLVSKLKGEATQALQSYRQEYDNLTAAQGRATEANRRWDEAQDPAFAKASIRLPLLAEQTRAQNALTEQTTKTSAAYEEYSTKATKVESVTRAATGSSTILAGVLGGAVVAGAMALTGAMESVVEHVAEGVVEAFKMGVEGAKEFADTMIELGESYEHLSVQITEFSTVSGEELEKTEQAARTVFGQLDVAGKNTGQTMAQLSTMLHAPAEDIKTLVLHVEDLQGRFTSLKTTDLASIFVAFKTPAEQADAALASLLQSARGSGQDMGALTSALSGTAAVTLQEAGLNIQQAGKFTAELLELGAPGQRVMTGMATAMKDFGKEGLTFAEGMKLAGEKLKQLGDTAEGQDLAEKLFGARNWTVAMQAVQNYVDIVKQGPDAFNASGQSVDDFIQKTRMLQNEWELVKHRAEEAFLPMGLEAVHLVGTGLDNLVHYIDDHINQIKGIVKAGGLFLINFASTVQQFAIGVLEFMSPIVNAIDSFMGMAISNMGAFAHMAGDILSLIPGFGDIGSGLVDMGKSAESFGLNLEKINVGDKMEHLADWLKQHKIDVEGASDDWMHFSDNVTDAMSSANSAVDSSHLGAGLGQGLLGAPGGAGGFPFPVPGAPGGAPGGGGGPLGALAGASGAGAGAGSAEANKALARQLFPWPESEWAAYEQLEMKEAGFNATAKNPSSGAFGIGQFYGHEHDKYAAGYSTDPATQIRTQFQYIADTYGTPSKAWAQYYNHPGGEGSYAHGGPVMHPGGGYGPEDFDSMEEYRKWYLLQGIMHHIEEAGYDEGGPVMDPDDFANLEQYRHALHLAQILGHIERMGYASGGKPGRFATGGRGGIDDIPALLTQGEYVWDTNTVDKHGWLIQALHKGDTQSLGAVAGSGSRGKGHSVGTHGWFGPPMNLHGPRFGQMGPGVFNPWRENREGVQGFDDGGPVDYTGAQRDTIAVAQAAQQMFNIHDIGLYRSPDGYNEHASGEAADVMVGTNRDLGNSVAQYFLQYARQYGVQYVLWQQTQWNPDGTSSGMPDRGGATANHLDHVHVRTLGGGFPGGEDQPKGFAAPKTGQYSDVPSVIAQYTASGGGGTPPVLNGGYPGMPGQFGGYGAYGAETYDQVVNAQQATQEAKDRAADLDYQISQNQKKIDDLKAKLAAPPDATELGLLTGQPLTDPATQKKIQDRNTQINDQLAEAQHALAVSQRERSEQDGKITEAQRKEQEAGFKKPSGSQMQQPKAVGTEAFAQLGGSLLSGIGQELGFGDLFSKPPWEWGAVKLLTGGINWAMGTANAWADEIGKGHTGMTGFQPVAGFDQPGGALSGLLGGVTGSVGITLPGALTKPSSVSSGPNIVQTQPGPGYMNPTGPAPGPVVQGDYMPINVSPNVDPRAVLGPVQEQRNSNNATLQGQTGGLPH